MHVHGSVQSASHQATEVDGTTTTETREISEAADELNASTGTGHEVVDVLEEDSTEVSLEARKEVRTEMCQRNVAIMIAARSEMVDDGQKVTALESLIWMRWKRS
jgi:hypothetical protein